VPIKVTCYLILLLRYAGSMSYFLCDGAGYHITCIQTDADKENQHKEYT